MLLPLRSIMTAALFGKYKYLCISERRGYNDCILGGEQEDK